MDKEKNTSTGRRGRPKKILSPEEIAAAAIPKKRGRPPKKISSPEEISAPKKRGRPAKEILPEEKISPDAPTEKLFALDIGTRSVIGIVAEKNSAGELRILETCREEHKTRAMLDGQIHDVPQVAKVIGNVKSRLEKKCGKLTSAAVAAAGRALYTVTAVAETDVDGVVSEDDETALEFAAVQLAQSNLAESRIVNNPANYFCVGFSVVSHELDGVRLKTLVGQRGKVAKAKVIATFLPRQVIDSMQIALETAGLEMQALTLEPIAAINVLIPPTMRHLNLVLVDIGAGTSDIAITREGSVTAYGMVPKAGDEITEGLSQKLLLDFNVAEEIKRRAANGEGATIEDILGRQSELSAEEIVSAIRDNIASLASEISRTILELNGYVPPQAVMLVGGGSLTPHIQKFVAEALNIPEDRAAVRRPEKVAGVEKIPEELCKPDAVTPLGILKIASTGTLHFLSVKVNGEEYGIFNFREMKISDALLTAGISPRKFSGKPGAGIVLTIDGKRKFFAGSLGTPPTITLDGEPATLETPITNNCAIKIERGTDGIPPTLRLCDVASLEPAFGVYINGTEEKVAPKLTVNGEVSLPTRILMDGDEVESLTPRTVGEVLRLAGYPPTGTKIRYTLNGSKAHYDCKPEILLDDEPADLNAKIKPGVSIEYIPHETLKVADIIEISGIATSTTFFYGGKEFEIPTPASVELTVNGRPATTNTLVDDGAEIEYKKTAKVSGTVSDALLAINFQPPPAKSRMGFVIKVNGRPAEFVDPVTNGDTLEVILKTPDGVELPSVAGEETVINAAPTRENVSPAPSGERKFTISDFIRND